MIAIKRKFDAYLDEMQIITILLPYSYHQGASSAFYINDGTENIPLSIQERIPLPDTVKYVCRTEFKPEIGKMYSIIDEYGEKTDLQIGAVIRTKEFDESYAYGGEDLGVTIYPDKTLFKLWAPTATQAKLKLSKNDDGASELRVMHRGEKGVWSIEVEGSLELYRYSFLVCINLEWREAADPYARAVTVNGKSGVIVNLDKTRTAIQELPPFENPCDAVIYETHVRDLTIHPASGVTHKGKYLGAAELDTKSPSGEATGLSYIKDFGITHVEFLPFHDFEGVDELDPAKEYNWGYNPVHFNVPDGSYSLDPTDPYKRIIELKQLISAVHSQGMRVIMDAVYNHVYIRETSPFEQIVPGYYFRHDADGLPSNGTGVGNDFASERAMARKFIVDSVSYWMEEFHLDGLRFDLMGILDISTMKAVRKKVDKIDPSALIIGEGWDLNTPIPNEEKASIGNQAKIPEIGQFNDWFRDTIKGSTFNLYDRGYALGNERYTESAKQVLAGSIGIGKRKSGLFLEPTQSVNYVESHDNHTLWDKMKACEQDSIEKRHRLATSMVLLAQGIPFLHSGQEFFRTKKGTGNSYRSPNEINWLDWELRDANLDNVRYIQGILAIRRSHGAFRLPKTSLIRTHMSFSQQPPPVIGYTLSEVGAFGKWNTIAAFFNPSLELKSVDLPEESEWKILADQHGASAEPLRAITAKSMELPPCSLLIAAK